MARRLRQVMSCRVSFCALIWWGMVVLGVKVWIVAEMVGGEKVCEHLQTSCFFGW